MDSVIKNLNSASKLLSQRRTKAYFIGVLVLVTIAWLQTQRTPVSQPLVELFSQCKLQPSDLNRIQLAFGKAGLKDYQLRGNKLYVPQPKQLEYIQAVADQEALPRNFDEVQSVATVTNPFLTHTQQLSLQREHRKKNLQELIRMLPFVDQAWLEMDDASDRFAYRPTHRSAVVSVRPVSHQPLMEPQIATIRELVAGAVNGISAEQIVVIDLDTGNAFRGKLEAAPLEKKWSAQRAKFTRQRWLESQLRLALECYPEVEINIVICDAMINREDKLAQPHLERLPAAIANSVSDADETGDVPSSQSKAPKSLYGANGIASLDDWGHAESKLASTKDADDEFNEVRFLDSFSTSIAQVSYTTDLPATEVDLSNQKLDGSSHSLLKVTIAVPASLLLDSDSNGRFISVGNSQGFRMGGLSQAELEQRFESLKTNIEARIAPLLELYQDEMATALDVKLVGAEHLTLDWRSSLVETAASQWPSLAVLLAGVVLIGLVGIGGRRQEPQKVDLQPNPSQSIDGDQLVTDSSRTGCLSSDAETEAVKARLSALIEKDPSTAARVIENWIRESNSS